jgi:hypothetical protein
MFRAAHRSSSGALKLNLQPLVYIHMRWPAAVKSHSALTTASQRMGIKTRGWKYSLEFLMMSGVPLETCWAFNKLWNNKFYYKVASCWLFLLILKFLVTVVARSDKCLEIAWHIFICLLCVDVDSFTFYLTQFRNSCSLYCWPWIQLLQNNLWHIITETFHLGVTTTIQWPAVKQVSVPLSYLRN